jgi:hypothetical protein
MVMMKAPMKIVLGLAVVALLLGALAVGFMYFTKATLAAPIDSPAMLDRLWAVYFVTGDETAVQRIISVVHWYEDGKTLNEGLLGGAAQWSLGVNAKRSARLRKIIEKELATSDVITKRLLGEILEGKK